MKKLINHSTDPAFNLAFEEYFTARAKDIGDSLIFFWRNRPSVIVGRFQNSFGEVDAPTAEALGVGIFRRNTGGGAVYHDLNNLNYSFIVPAGSADYLKDAKSSAPFGLLFDIILELLASLGVKAEKTGRNDLTLDGRKISGAARQLTKTGLLLHGTLLFDVDLESLSRVLSVDPAKYESKGLKSVKSRVCNLKEALPKGMDITSFQAALESALVAEEYVPSAKELAEIEELAQRKFRAWDWNWGASPPSSLRKKQRFAWGSVELCLDLENGIIKDAAIYGDFFSNAGILQAEANTGGEANAPTDALKALLGIMQGQRHQSEELCELLKKQPLERIFLGATTEDLNELIAFLAK